MISLKNLNKRICDCVEDATNTQTYADFIKESEDTFGLININLKDKKLTDEYLQEYFEFLNDLWLK